MKNYDEKIIDIGKTNGGYIVGKEISARGIPTVCLTRMRKAGELTRLAPGIYLLGGYPEDEFYTLALRFSGAVFSRRSALYLNGITNRQIENIEVNFANPYSNRTIVGVRSFRVSRDLYELGKNTVTTPLGHQVKSYNIERCICDLFYYDDFDIEEKSFAIRSVDRNAINYDKLFAYAKQMKVLPQVKSVFEVL